MLNKHKQALDKKQMPFSINFHRFQKFSFCPDTNLCKSSVSAPILCVLKIDKTMSNCFRIYPGKKKIPSLMFFCCIWKWKFFLSLTCFISLVDTLLSAALHPLFHHLSLCLMTCCSSRQAPNIVPSGRGCPTKIYPLIKHKILFCM